MKKFLSILAAVGLTSTAAVSVVACGKKDKVKVIETGDLNDIVSETDAQIAGSGRLDTADKALAAFLNTPAGKQLNKDNVQVKDGSYTPAGIDTDGRFVIIPKTGTTSYSGALTITIKGYKKQSLGSVIRKADRQVIFNGINSYDVDLQESEDALAAFLAISDNEFLQDQVEVKSFLPISFPDLDGDDDDDGGDEMALLSDPIDQIKDGNLVIKAKDASSNEYTGELTITLKWARVSLDSVKDQFTTEIQGNKDLNKDTAYAQVIQLPGNMPLDYETDIDENSFVAPTVDQDGKFDLVAVKDSITFTGKLTITIIG